MFTDYTQHHYYYDHQVSKNQTVYKFKDGSYRGLLGIPNRAKTEKFWYRFFIKGDSESYHTLTSLHALPHWFFDLVVETMERLEAAEEQEVLEFLNTTHSEWDDPLPNEEKDAI